MDTTLLDHRHDMAARVRDHSKTLPARQRELVSRMLQTALDRLPAEPVKMDPAQADEQFEEAFRDGTTPTMWTYDIWTYRF